MLISRALKKYGLENFSLEILEYCSVENLLKREQHYLDMMKPEYNICKTAGSRYKNNSDKKLNHQLFTNDLMG